ncbi:DUF4834 domain-containing protein [Mucilaginibacter sp.]|jgi:hypothetical protein|uniref:DUF4834 domain-containing protein n=1 Tax=Mucilaginibacter sp. TaxID=1882438 RepID=UPI002B51A7E3|nr:DUF4834 domain-containing protein [Mucilaginibacter sp.]HTI59640.1 hypothetical protein [Mucilaginibacter sp.]
MLLLRFLFFAILIMYIIRALVRLLLPMLFQGMVNKAQQQGQQQYRSQKQPEGKVKVDYIPENKSSIPDSEGDFIDYEEIK